MAAPPLKCHVVIGTRPEAIKLAPVAIRLRQRPDLFDVTIVASAQHGAICDEALNCFGLCADATFAEEIRNDGLASFAGGLLRAYGDFLARNPTELVLVQGDTTTALMAALAAFYAKIPVAHVEAGLRSGDLLNPFPEEANRRMVDAVSTLLLAPTQGSARNLLTSGHDADRVAVTGNTVVDALRIITGRNSREMPDPLAGIDLCGKRLIVLTSHRRESWGQELQNICLAAVQIAQRNPDCIIVFPVHPNPQVQQPVQKVLSGRERIHLLPPLDYVTFLGVIQRASLVLTDSGGVQEEAPSLGVPVLVLRRTTERGEAIEAGLARLVGTACEDIVSAAQEMLDRPTNRGHADGAVNPFGDGRACERIERILLNWRSGRTPLLDREDAFDDGIRLNALA